MIIIQGGKGACEETREISMVGIFETVGRTMPASKLHFTDKLYDLTCLRIDYHRHFPLLHVYVSN